MDFLLLTPLWNSEQSWRGVLALGPTHQLQSLAAALSQQPLPAHLPCFLPPQQPLLAAGGMLAAPSALQGGLIRASQLPALPPGTLAHGPWYSHGQGASGQPAKPALLELIGLISADADTPKLEKVFAHAPELTFRLLRLVNSVGLRARVEIQSIRHAITVLGRTQLERWVQTLLYAEHSADGQGMSPLLIAALLRARRLANWAEHRWLDCPPDSAFLLGMLSLLDQLLAQPMAELLEPLPLSPKLRAALLDGQGELGLALQQVRVMENAQAEQLWAIHPHDQAELWVRAELDALRGVADLAAQWQA
ncbi:HDOD domain-containing protein [Chitinibacter tainanensis]|uniref:HDOD domain-containing protein n=1 Tax=Chitinibacter tainanensis TaxID=230667 RepID=UPI0004127293|nr:HDOD domain-containing protein [Chitinibacter tainanensis]